MPAEGDGGGGGEVDASGTAMGESRRAGSPREKRVRDDDDAEEKPRAKVRSVSPEVDAAAEIGGKWKGKVSGKGKVKVGAQVIAKARDSMDDTSDAKASEAAGIPVEGAKANDVAGKPVADLKASPPASLSGDGGEPFDAGAVAKADDGAPSKLDIARSSLSLVVDDDDDDDEYTTAVDKYYGAEEYSPALKAEKSSSASASISPGSRVKLYFLDHSSAWDDRGTGHVVFEAATGRMTFRSEEGGGVALRLEVRPDTTYALQGTTIISWMEGDAAAVSSPGEDRKPHEIALSFAEDAGCKALYEGIRAVQARMAAEVGSQPAAQAPMCMGVGRVGGSSGGMGPGVLSGMGSIFDDDMDGNAASVWGSENINETTGFPSEGSPAASLSGIGSGMFLSSVGGGGTGGGISADSPAALAAAAFSMPRPERSGLEALAALLSDAGPVQVASIRERVVAEVSAGDYVARLCDVFRVAEDLEDVEGLRLLYFVFRSLFVLGNNGVVEHLVNGNNILSVIGALEYEPDLFPVRKPEEGGGGSESGEKDENGNGEKGRNVEALVEAKMPKSSPSNSSSGGNSGNGDGGKDRSTEIRRHRNFLTRQALFRSVVSIPDASVVAKIHQNYRVSYIKDVILSRVLDDSAHSALQSLIFFNNIDIVCFFVSENTPLLEDLFSQFRSVLRVQSAAGLIVGSAEELSRLGDDGLGAAGACAESRKSEERIEIEKSTVGVTSLNELPGSGAASSGIADSSGTAKLSCSDVAMKKEGSHEKSENDVSVNAENVPGKRPAGSPSKRSDATFPKTSKAANADDVAESSDTVLLSENAAHASSRVPCETADAGMLPSKSCHDGASTEKLRSLLCFLNELCSLAKQQQALVRTRFHHMLRDLGVLEVALETLRHRDVSIRLLGSDLLSSAVMHDQCDIRFHMLRNMPMLPLDVGAGAGGALSDTPFSGLEQERGGSLGQGGGVENLFTGGSSNRMSPSKSGGGTPGEKSVMTLPGFRSAPAPQGDSIASQEAKSSQGSNDLSSDEANAEDVALAGTESGDHIPITEAEKESKRDVDVKGDKVPIGEADCVSPVGAHSEEEAEGKSSPVSAGSIEVGKATLASTVMNKTEPSSSPSSTAAVTSPSPSHATSAPASSGLDTATSNRLFPLLGAMLDVICNDSDSGVFLTVLEQLRQLLDPSTMRSTIETERFLDVFYERFVLRLLEPLKLSPEDDITVPLSEERASLRVSSDLKSMDDSTSHLCDLLAFCVLNHAFRSKYFVLGYDVVGKVLKLLRHRRPHVRLAALRFCRACIGAEDDVYDRYIAKNKLLGPVFELFVANGHRDNLLNSAVLELVLFLASHHRSHLLEHIMENHSAVLEETLEYSCAFADARKSLEEIRSNMNSTGEMGVSGDSNGAMNSMGLAAGQLLGMGFGASDVAGVHHGSLSLDSHPQRFGPSLFAHHDIRIAPDQDCDEDYFASGGEDDTGMSELCRIMENSKSGPGLLPGVGDGGQHGMSSGVPLHGTSGPPQVPGRELMPARRASAVRSGSGNSVAVSPGTSPENMMGQACAEPSLARSADRNADSSSNDSPSSPTGMSTAYPLGPVVEISAQFDDSVLNSTWSNRSPSQRGAPLVDYPFDAHSAAPDAEDMFASDSNSTGSPSDSAIDGNSGAQRSANVGLDGSSRSGVALSLKLENGALKETTRIVPIGSNSGGGGSISSGSRGGVRDGGSSGSAGHTDSGGDGGGSGTNGGSSGDTVPAVDVVCDSDSSAPSSPKRRRCKSSDDQGHLSGNGIDVSINRSADSSTVKSGTPPRNAMKDQSEEAAEPETQGRDSKRRRTTEESPVEGNESPKPVNKVLGNSVSHKR